MIPAVQPGFRRAMLRRPQSWFAACLPARSVPSAKGRSSTREPRLLSEDPGRQSESRPLIADRSETRGAGIRQLHVRAVPRTLSGRGSGVPALQGPGNVRDGLRSRGAPHRWVEDGFERPDRSRGEAAHDIHRAAWRSANSSARNWLRAWWSRWTTSHDPAGTAYSGMPARLYVIDAQGKVAYKSGRGPFGFKPGEMEQSLVMTLLDDPNAVRVRDRGRVRARNR